MIGRRRRSIAGRFGLFRQLLPCNQQPDSRGPDPSGCGSTARPDPNLHWLGLFLCGFLWACGREQAAPPGPQAIPVTAAKVLVQDQPIYSEYIGQTRGSTEVQIRARVEGVLQAIHFDEGRLVKAGDLLYTLDPNPSRTAVAEAEAQLDRAQAAWVQAKQDLARFEPLIQRNAISRQQYDEAVGNVKATQAAVESAEGDLTSAKLQLAQTEIRAPVDGRIGKSEIQVGNLVGRTESTLLTTISTVDPISVRFSVSEREYLDWVRVHPNEEQNRESLINRFEMILADGSLYPYKGNLVFADRNVDQATGTLRTDVSFPNPGTILRPGQYARVRVAGAVLTNALLVPQRAIQGLHTTYSVFVVTPEHKAVLTPVVPGPRVDGLSVITSGLNSNDTVVIEGMQKLQSGALVQPTLVEISPDTRDQGAAKGSPAP